MAFSVLQTMVKLLGNLCAKILLLKLCLCMGMFSESYINLNLNAAF